MKIETDLDARTLLNILTDEIEKLQEFVPDRYNFPLGTKLK